MPVFETPRTRRLRTELKEMKKLADESSIMTFVADDEDAPEKYVVTFKGPGLDPKGGLKKKHEVEFVLGMDYPRTTPTIRFKTTLKHPNVSGSGGPCLGMFVWSPSVRLTEVVEIIWDMIRMANYNPYSAFESGGWSALRNKHGFPLDDRVLRDRSPRPAPPPEDDDEDIMFIGARGKEWSPRWKYDTNEELKQLIIDWLKERDLWHDTGVYTQEEWLARGEEYGRNSLVTIATEGPFYEILNDPSAYSDKILEEFGNFLKALGLWYEQGYAWTVHLYPE